MREPLAGVAVLEARIFRRCSDPDPIGGARYEVATGAKHGTTQRGATILGHLTAQWCHRKAAWEAGQLPGPGTGSHDDVLSGDDRAGGDVAHDSMTRSVHPTHEPERALDLPIEKRVERRHEGPRVHTSVSVMQDSA